MKILVADDDPVSRKLLQKLLEKWSHQVLVVEDGKRAWQEILQSDVQMVITDWMMPVMDGRELCKKVRSSDLERYVYIILLTGKNQKEDLIEGLSGGADDFLVKPFNQEELKVRIRVGKRVVELEKTNRVVQSQILQSEKLASIGQLAAGVAHEINNPTGFINSNLNTLGEYQKDLTELIEVYQEMEKIVKEEYSGKGGGIMELLEKIQCVKEKIDLDFILTDLSNVVEESKEGTERIKKIVTDLKDFSHVDQCESKYVNINNCLESTLNMVWNELKYKATVLKEYGDIPEIKCFPQQLNQVFMNLLINASQAIEEKGEITIYTGNFNGQVEINISDTGKGIAKEVLPRIYDPFFTTKPVGKGTGLGLNIAYGIIQKHHGTIAAESKVGTGTTFTIKIPVEAV